MPRRNRPPERGHSPLGDAQRGKGRKRRSGWHRGATSDTTLKWLATELPAVDAPDADPTAAAPTRVHDHSDRRGGHYGSKLHGDAL